MKKLKAHLRTELQKSKPNPYLIEKLRFYINKGSMTLEEWRDTGVIMNKRDFSNKRALQKETTQVVVYLGKYFIEVKKPNTFYIANTEHQSTVLDDIENILWKIKVEKDLHI